MHKGGPVDFLAGAADPLDGPGAFEAPARNLAVRLTFILGTLSSSVRELS